jgi:ABC-2 type transport system ATP-binding protein
MSHEHVANTDITYENKLTCFNKGGSLVISRQSEIHAENFGKPSKKAERGGLAVEASGLVKVFGDNRAVDGVDLAIPTGCIYGLLGPNGAGKTTIINMLATLLKPDGGIARVFDHDVQREAQIVRQLISVAGQFAALDEKLSATENLTIFGLLLGLNRSEARKRAAELLEEFGLANAGNRTIDKFSGGMRRKLDVAASLIVQSPLIFLDEPTTGLDPRTRIQMWKMIKRLVSSGSTILLTTQYLDEADQLADRIAVIDHGRVVAEGTPSELKAAVGIATLRIQLADKKDNAEAMRITQKVLSVKASAPEPALITAPMADPERLTDLLLALRQAAVQLSQVNVQEPTLDEVFLALTAGDRQVEIGAPKQ